MLLGKQEVVEKYFASFTYLVDRIYYRFKIVQYYK